MTIKEVAKEAGVSTATVSYVLNNTKNVSEDKRQRVLEVVEKSGYRPNNVAKSLRTKKTNSIGVLLEDIMGYPTPSIMNGISEYAEKCDYNILINDLRMLEGLFNNYDQINQYKEKINEAVSLMLFGANVDALIYVGVFDRDLTGVISDINKPLVIAYSSSRDSHCKYVSYENECISQDAVRYLFNLGHRRIAVITGLAHTAPARTRLRGVQNAFNDAGAVLEAAFVKNGDWEYESGRYCMEDLLSQDVRPTAVFAMNDIMAAGAIDAIMAAGLEIPRDIAVIGFDNREFASYLMPRLSTIEIDLKGIGRKAAEIAIRGIEAPKTPQSNIILPCKIILRETTASPGN